MTPVCDDAEARPTLRRVLLVDDSTVVLSALTRVVGSIPHAVVVATGASADEGIAAAQEHQPHVAIVDVNMPGGGPAACAGIRAVSPRTVVIALSALDDALHRRQMAEAGAVDYLRKGRPMDEVKAWIERWLEAATA